LAKYKDHREKKAVEMGVAESFLPDKGSMLRTRDIHTKAAPQPSPGTFQKINLNSLLVVMTAVDWWKSHKQETLIGFLKSSVQWIFLRQFGNPQVIPTTECVKQFHQQSIRTIPTRSSQFLHMRLEYHFFAASIQRGAR
jgi:hypothetical protein